MDVKPEEKSNTAFGYFGKKPKCLQIFNNPKAFLFFMCVFSFVQGFVVNGVTNVNMTSLERRFHLSSSQAGFIASSYDIAAGVSVIPVSYYAIHAHKPRMLAVSAIVLGMGSMVMSIPHYVTDLYTFGNGERDLCSSIGNDSTCAPDSESNVSNYMYVLIFGQLIQGLAGAVIYSVGISSIDDTVSANMSPLYIGIFMSFAAFGPAIGYLAGGQFLDLYVDFDKVDSNSLGITPSDPAWIGSWWLSYIISAGMALALSLPFFGYARELPCNAARTADITTQVYKVGHEEKTSKVGFGSSVRDLPLATWVLLKNPIFVLVSLTVSLDGLSVAGFAAFLPKFIQNQYGQSASFSALVTGLIAVVGAAVGKLLGGIICKQFKLKVPQMLKMCAIASVVVILGMSALWANCPQEKIPGVTISYSDSLSSPMEVNLDAPCNAQCGCTSERYSPVCADNGVFYFSQCHAGCKSGSADKAEFYNCSCVLEDSSYTGNSTTVASGKCGTTCSMMYIFLSVFFFAMLGLFITSAPCMAITLRCTPVKQGSFAIGLQWLFVRCIGTIPGPIIYGATIDRTCIQWQWLCGEQASCWIYDNAKMSMYLFIIAVSLKLVVFVLFLVANCIYKSPNPVFMATVDRFNSVDSGVDVGVEFSRALDDVTPNNDNTENNAVKRELSHM